MTGPLRLPEHPRLALLGLLAALVAAVAIVLALRGPDADAAATLRVTERDGSISVARHSVVHGRVTFVVRNRGSMEHELVVIRTRRAASRLPVHGGKASDDGKVGEVEDIEDGATKRATLRLRAGHYVLICNVPGHYQAGMRTSLTVR
jgi:uncharacterized cupredoxin-like copper-binding protein